MKCGNCDKTDGLCYTSYPPKVKCTITHEFHFYDDECDCELYTSDGVMTYAFVETATLQLDTKSLIPSLENPLDEISERIDAHDKRLKKIEDAKRYYKRGKWKGAIR